MFYKSSRVLSGVLSLALVGATVLSNGVVASADGGNSGGGFQASEVVVHTTEEFLDAFNDDSCRQIYVANDLDFSEYTDLEPLNSAYSFLYVTGYDEETGREVQRTISNVEVTTSGLSGYEEQPDTNAGFIHTYGGISNISFEGVTLNVDSTYERGGDVHPTGNVLSTCLYDNVYIYDLTVNLTGYFKVFSVFGDAWNLYNEENIIVDGVTINGGDINVLNVLSYYTGNTENVDIRNVEVNADSLFLFETVANTIGGSKENVVGYSDDWETNANNITVSDITINNDIVGFAGISVNLPIDANNVAVQDVYINGYAEYVSGLGYVYDDTTISNFLVRNINVEGLNGDALFGGVYKGAFWNSADSQEEMFVNKGITNGYVDLQSPYLGGIVYGGIFNNTLYDATGTIGITGDNVFYTTDTPLVGTNPEYANLDGFNATLVDGSSVDEVYDVLKEQSNAWTVRDDGTTPVLDILPWYEIPSDSLALKLLRIKKYILGVSTEYDESLDLNGDGVVNVLDANELKRQLLHSSEE